MAGTKNVRGCPRLLGVVLSFMQVTSVSAAAPVVSGDSETTTPASNPADGSVDASSGVDTARVESLYESAKTLYDEGQYEAAATAFEAAYALTPAPNLLFNIYVCYDRTGDLDEALEYLERYAEHAAASEQQDLERRRKSLLARMDRQQRERAQARKAAEPPPASVVVEPVHETKDTVSEEPRPRVFGVAAGVLTGVTAAALGVGIGLGAASRLQTNAGSDHCTGTDAEQLCTAGAEKPLARARNYALGADIGFAVAGAAAIALITVVAVKAAKRRSSKAARIAPSVGPKAAGVTFQARF